MSANNKLMEMLTGYAASHQHPFNVFVHMIGIPTIMLGVLIPLTRVAVEVDFDPPSLRFTLAHVVVAGFFLFYLTLDVLFAVAFLVFALLLTMLASLIGDLGSPTLWVVAAACFFGGYAAQFVGHAVEKSMPVLVRHPVQANLAAPFFTVVEMFKILGLRDRLFNEVQQEIAARRDAESGSA
ncbi:MAG: Mpo1-like protein [Woeseiaceae bacterium]|nr:Mpo1-like protein [Woeseiaceae bacterium]